ncbi:hypothetical protein [Pararcticibacter amylolyticus]|uniref:DUF1772 domain-containing protein n=1 Tax=Pararcticibacter amylolyticus TaxID=2173175 RepID=A0A2U2PIZ3_9SPHI|nr:hypothetical protein [Pararcticibacter amylolyticus]PWG81376.1 hypothetical protein DDR33_05910 [Pararcticibacter amylolyticus]
MKIKIFVLHLAIVVSSGLLFVNIYNSIVDAPNWGYRLPQSVDVARRYFAFKNPAEFFKITGPLIHIIGINCVIRFWRTDTKVRWFNVTALALILFADLLSFKFFFPLNEVLFGSTRDVTLIRQAFHQWEMLNWFRSAVLAAIPVMYSLSLARYIRLVLNQEALSSPWAP